MQVSMTRTIWIDLIPMETKPKPFFIPDDCFVDSSLFRNSGAIPTKSDFFISNIFCVPVKNIFPIAAEFI